jgi:hypothetical protein
MQIILNILGNVGLLILIYLTLVWNLGVRKKLDSGFHVINGAIFFLLSSISIIIFDINYLYSWLLILGGFIITFISFPAYDLGIPIISSLIKLIPSLYAILLRIGISEEEIKKIQIESNNSIVKKWANRHEKIN